MKPTNTYKSFLRRARRFIGDFLRSLINGAYNKQILHEKHIKKFDKNTLEHSMSSFKIAIFDVFIDVFESMIIRPKPRKVKFTCSKCGDFYVSVGHYGVNSGAGGCKCGNSRAYVN